MILDCFWIPQLSIVISCKYVNDCMEIRSSVSPTIFCRISVRRAISTVMYSQQLCKQAKSARPTRGVTIYFTTHGRTPSLAMSIAGAKAMRLTRFVDRMYVCARACPFGVYFVFHL